MSYPQIPSGFTKESLTKTPDRFSDDAWNLILASEKEAIKWRHEYLDVEHMIQVLFTDNKYKSIVNALPINNDDLLDQLEEFLADLEISNTGKLFVGEDLEVLLDTANIFRGRWGSKYVEVSHLLIAIARDKRIGYEIFNQLGLTSEVLEGNLRRLPKPMKVSNNARTIDRLKQNQLKEKDIERKTQKGQKEDNADQFLITNEKDKLKLEKEANPIDIYGTDLTYAALNGYLDPVIGREDEINITLKVLSRRGKNNPVLIGPPGVGKTAIAALLAQKIIEDEVPDSIKDLKLISLDIGALIAGTKLRGQFEERLRSVLKQASDPNEGVVLFIDELHTILNNERSSTNAASILKPVLANGEIRCIGATTLESYRQTIEKDPALNRRFQQVIIKEPSVELSVEILRGIKERYETHHSVKITDEALITANNLADRYISDRCLPDKAIDLIDEAAAQIKMESRSKPREIRDAESELNRIKKILISEKDTNKNENIKELKITKELLISKIEGLMNSWNIQKSMIDEMNQLIEEEIIINESIESAIQRGDLEEASKLEFNDLHYLQNKVKEINNQIIAFKENGSALIKDQVDPEDIAEVVAQWTGIPVNKVLAGEKQKLLDLENELSKKVIGQIEAVKAVSAAIKRARAGMKDNKRPIGSFLLLGPTGVGKTELAKTLASFLFDESEALIRLDMSEFMERNAVARLIGAPPGYVGYEQGGQLTEAIRRRPYSVLLLDEVEKAHPDVFNLLLQVLDDGRLTDSHGRTIDFRHTVVVMTSNLASREILENAKLSQKDNADLEQIESSLDKSIEDALSKHFRPEFLNRIDEVIRFKPLTLENIKLIIQLQLNDLRDLISEQNLDLIIDSSTIEALALEAFQPEFGARPLRRVIRRRIENPLATKLLEDHFIGASAIKVRTSHENPKLLEFLAEA